MRNLYSASKWLRLVQCEIAALGPAPLCALVCVLLKAVSGGFFKNHGQDGGTDDRSV
jgi:hypothetical protein